MKYVPTLLFLFFVSCLQAQYYEATVQEDYRIRVQKKNEPLPFPRSEQNAFDQQKGFPLSFTGDKNSKNFRNVALEDINDDGVKDIVFTAGNRLMVYAQGEILWTRVLTGTGIYPPAIADINDDGRMEIVQATGGNGRKGRLYALDADGNDLPGFPKNYSDNWILTAPSLADLDEDGLSEIIFLERNSPGGIIHILKQNGTPFSSDWPIRLPGTPAVTPSVGDIDNDGNKEIVVASTTVLYAFDLSGKLKEGWPIDNPDTKFSFQSPILADIDLDGDLEIIGATHGNVPEYYIYQHDGTPYGVWPFYVPDQEWTFCTPTVIVQNEQYEILMSRPARFGYADVLYNWNPEGELQNGFPIEKEGGLEGIITVADIDNDDEMELIFGSNRLDETGKGFIHAYNMDGAGQVEGFPIRPKGWTLMNGAAPGDINGDGKMDLTVLTYTTNPGSLPDSVFLNVYELNVPYSPEKVLWNTYKSSNLRSGDLSASMSSSISRTEISDIEMTISPNPITGRGRMKLTLEERTEINARLISTDGKVQTHILRNELDPGRHEYDLPEMPEGIYFLQIMNGSKGQKSQKIIFLKNN